MTLSLVHLIFHIRLKVRCGRLESMQVSTLVFARERKDRWGMMLDGGGKHPPPGSSLLLFLSLEMKSHVLTCKCCGRGRESRMLRLGSTCIANQLNPPSKLRERHARLYCPFNETELNQKQIGCAFFWRHAVSLIVFAWCKTAGRENRVKCQKRKTERESLKRCREIVDENFEKKARNVEWTSRVT